MQARKNNFNYAMTFGFSRTLAVFVVHEQRNYSAGDVEIFVFLNRLLEKKQFFVGESEA